MAAGDATRTLLARFSTDTSQLDRTAQRLGGQGRQMGDRLASGFEAGAGRLRRIATTVLGFAVVRGAFNQIRDTFSTMTAEARESQKVSAQTEQVIKTMGATSWTSAQQISALSDALSRKRGVDDELIQSGANVLLTFGAVRNEMGRGNDVFNRATAIAHDMSVALGTNMNAAAIQVGKALNDPIKGMTALTRSGVSFTQQQKDQVRAMVEAGDTLGAQKLILAEMERQFAGSAEAQATFGDKVRASWANLLEMAGGFLLPMLDRLFSFLNDRGLPALSALATTVGTKVQPHLTRFGDWLVGTGIPALRELGNWLLTNVVPVVLELGNAFTTHVLPVIIQFGGFLVQTVIPALAEMFVWFNEHRTVVGVVAAAIAGLIVLQKAHTASMAVARAGGMVAWLGQMAKSTAAYSAATKVAAAVQWLLNAALAANPIGLVILALVALGGALYLAWTRSETFRNIVTGAWRAIQDGVGAAWGWISSNVFSPFMTLINTAQQRAVSFKDGVVRAFQGMRDGVGSAFGELKGRILAPIASVIRWINSNLIGNINKVTKHFNLTIPSIPVPKYHDGGFVRGRPGSEQPAVLQAGEAVISRRRLAQLARRAGASTRGVADMLTGSSGPSGLAEGGPFDWVSDAAGAVSGVVSDIGSQISGWLRNGAAFAMEKIMSPVVNAVGGVLTRNGGTRFFGEFLTGMMEDFKDAAVRWARGQDAAETDTIKGIGALAGKPTASGWSKPIGPGYRIGRGSKGHGYLAQDLPAPIGTPIYAMHDGRVIRAQDLATSYGKHVFVAHPGTTGVYAHMSVRYAGLNDMVRSGQILGRVGSTGNSTGPHLHLETRGFDPLSFLRARGINFDHGGRLAPGLNVVDNRTGGFEDLVNRDDLPVIHVHVYLGDREITDIVRVEVKNERRNEAADLYATGVHP